MRVVSIVIGVLLITVAPTTGQPIRNSKRAEIFVLATLHQFHADSNYYSFEKLSQIIKDVDPDIICVELTAADIKSRRKQGTKVEYEKSVFPLVDKYGYRVVPLEPDEPKFSQLVGLNVESEKDLRTNEPARALAFSLYTETLYKHLFSTWTSPIDVNSAVTDSHFEVKHNYQNAIYGEKQQKVWEGWNRHFLDQIMTAAGSSRGKKVLVLVGVEHAYWLRKELRGERTVKLREAASFLK